MRPFRFDGTGRASDDALHTSLPGSPPPSANVGSPHGSGHDLDGMGTRSFSLNLYTSKRRLLEFLLLRIGCLVCIYISKTLGDFASRLTEMMLPQHQMYRVLHDPGPQWNTSTAPQLQGPMAQGLLMTTGTHDEGLILPQAQKMNNHQVPSYIDSLANNTSKELHSGSIPFGKGLVCWHVTKLREFIAKQAPCQSDFFETRGKCQDFVVRFQDAGIP